MTPIHADRRAFLRLTTGAVGLAASGVVLPRTAWAAPAAPLATGCRFASTRLRVPDRLVSLSGTDDRAVLWRQSAGSPPYTVRNPRVCLPGFYCNNGGAEPTERIVEDHFEVAYALEVGGVRHRAKFSGTNWTSRGGTGAEHGYNTDFDWGRWSDPIPIEIPANSNIFHCTLVKIGEFGTQFPGAIQRSPLIGDQARTATDAAALEGLLSGSGAITSAGSSPGRMYAPMYMVAEDDSGAPVVLIVGDSRAFGHGDMGQGNSEPRAPWASVERGLDSTRGGRIATGNITVPGSRTSGSVTPPGLTHRVTPLLKLADSTGKVPFTHILDQHGNNGLDWASLVSHVQVLKGFFPSIPYVKVTIPPRVGRTTADAYRTLDGQLPSAYDSYPSGARAMFNNDVLANRDDLFTSVFHAGKYGMGGDDTDFNRSRFKVFPERSGALTRAWAGSNPLYLNFQPLYGDRLSFDPANPAAGGLVQSATAVGSEWQVGLEVGHSSGSYPAGASFACTPTEDGTHESARMYMVEAAAYEDMKLAGLFG